MCVCVTVSVRVRICVHILYSWKFCQFRHLLLLAKFLSANFFCPVLIITWRIWRPVYCIGKNLYFCNTKVAGLDEIFVQPAIYYYYVRECVCVCMCVCQCVRVCQYVCMYSICVCRTQLGI